MSNINNPIVDPCIITQVDKLFQASLTQEVAKRLFEVLEQKKLSWSDSSLETLEIDDLKNNRWLLAIWEKLKHQEDYQNLLNFLQNPIISRCFRLAISSLTKAGRILPGNIENNTEHATYFNGQPSIEKITARLQERQKTI